MTEFIRVRKDEWDNLRKDIELFIQQYESSNQKIKDLSKENNSLREELRSIRQSISVTEQKTNAELQQTSEVLKKMRGNISRVLQQTQKEIEK